MSDTGWIHTIIDGPAAKAWQA